MTNLLSLDHQEETLGCLGHVNNESHHTDPWSWATEIFHGERVGTGTQRSRRTEETREGLPILRVLEPERQTHPRGGQDHDCRPTKYL